MGVAGERIRAVEARISKNEYETAVAFDLKGNVLFEKIGIEDEVGFTLGELSQLKGNILTHNHAYNHVLEDFGIVNTSAFSSDDLIIAYQQGLQEARMVIGNETHIFQWNNPQKRAAEHFFYNMDILEREYNESINAAKEKANIAINEADNNPTLQNEEAMEKAVIEFFKVQNSQADKINEFISSNQHIGYVFRKERV